MFFRKRNVMNIPQKVLKYSNHTLILENRSYIIFLTTQQKKYYIVTIIG